MEASVRSFLPISHQGLVQRVGGCQAARKVKGHLGTCSILGPGDSSACGRILGCKTEPLALWASVQTAPRMMGDFSPSPEAGPLGSGQGRPRSPIQQVGGGGHLVP